MGHVLYWFRVLLSPGSAHAEPRMYPHPELRLGALHLQLVTRHVGHSPQLNKEVKKPAAIDGCNPYILSLGLFTFQKFLDHLWFKD